MRDVMGGQERVERRVHEHGLVALVDAMPRLVPEGRTADVAVVQAARTSTGRGIKSPGEDERLVRYLMRHRHTTPFEMVQLKFHVRLPIFVARQWIRHRTGSFNEYSARYSEVPDVFYRPREARLQGAGNRQGGEEVADEALAHEFHRYLDAAEESHGRYSGLLRAGASRELARIGLPLSAYTEWYWRVDLHNLFGFLQLRLDSHAQAEIRDYAAAVLDLVRPVAPVSVGAFEDYRLNAVVLSRPEVESIRAGVGGLPGMTGREVAELATKREKLGLSAGSRLATGEGEKACT